jgi:hypothetical protein
VLLGHEFESAPADEPSVPPFGSLAAMGVAASANVVTTTRRGREFLRSALGNPNARQKKESYIP